MSASVLHPKQEEQKRNKEQQKLITQSKRDFVIKLAKDSNLRFVHVRAKDDHEPKQILSKGGVTVVYQRSNLKNGRIVKVSCALVNDIDVYNKLEGRYRACLEFNAGHYISMRAQRYMTVNQFLKWIFEGML